MQKESPVSMSLFDALYTLYDALTTPTLAPLMLRALGTIFAGWAVYSVMFIGVGVGVARLFGARAVSLRDWLLAFWVGWGVCIAVLQVWHLFIPVNTLACGGLLALGITGLLFEGRALWALLQRVTVRGWAYVLAGSIVGVLFANAAMGAPSIGDFALYHQQVILWNQEYPIVRGLGNLHGRLAFNNATFLYAALVDVAPFAGVGNHIAASLLIMALAAWGLAGLRRVLHGELSPSALLMLFALPVVAWTSAHEEHIRTPNNDLPPLLLGMVLGVMVLELWARRLSQRQSAYTLFMLVFLGAVGVAGKLSFIVLAGACIVTGAVLYLRAHGRTGAAHLAIWSVSAALLVGALWVGRGVLLSGYPAYPSTFGAFDVDWRVACSVAITEADNVYIWARQPRASIEEVRDSNAWLLPWFTRTLRRDMEVFTPLLIFAGALLVRARQRRAPSQTWLFLLIPLVALGFWFVAAPDVRFAGAAFWLLAYGALCLCLSDYAAAHPLRVQAVAVVMALALSYESRTTFITYLPQAPHGFHAQPVAPLVQMTTDSGLIVSVPNVPETSEAEDRCYAADIPCTPYFNPALTLRETGNMGAGFRVEMPLACTTKPAE